VIELANGDEGYIPPPAQHDLGGYTTWPARTAALESKAEPKIRAALYQCVVEIEGRQTARLDLAEEYDVAILASKPLDRWQFDEFDATSLNQIIGQPPWDYESGIAYRTHSPFGTGVNFAGGRMKATLKDLGPTYTAEFWVWNGFPADVRPVTGYVFSRGEDADKQANGDHLGIGGMAGYAGKLIFFNGNAKNQTLGGKTALKLKEWYHVALVRDGEKVKVNLNGKEEIAGEAAVTVPAKCGQIFFGGRCDKFAGLEGRMDEAAIYNRALTAKEIADHFAAAGK